MYNERWDQFFHIIWNIPQHGWDIIKYKVAIKILEENSYFIMVFSGSSVTAGYSNHFNNSYPIILQNRLQSIFELLGIRLVVRNIASKHMGCRLINYCLEAMGGIEYDFIGT